MPASSKPLPRPLPESAVPRRIILVHGSVAGPEAASRREFVDAVLRELEARPGADLWVTPSLYDLPDRAPLWEELRTAAAGAVFCTWLYPRALRLLLLARGIPGAAVEAAGIFRYRPEVPPAEFAAELRAAAAPGGPRRVRRLDNAPPPAVRWYPILDRSRCRNCGQCFEFCIFGVYERREDGNIGVARPDNCKPGCPACARVCPFEAIVFPRETRDPRIAGAEDAAPRTGDPAMEEEARRRTRGRPPEDRAEADELDDLIRGLDALDL